MSLQELQLVTIVNNFVNYKMENGTTKETMNKTWSCSQNYKQNIEHTNSFVISKILYPRFPSTLWQIVSKQSHAFSSPKFRYEIPSSIPAIRKSQTKSMRTLSR